ncbi:hypothetical protein TorRG33x02_005840 [Trema orientale]|uniref:Reverse transcriptase zinc-binding domain-containing protein n=1 Tax=Trema orientale TaxID=63057 RepID=A0A2P5G045_TREOI|nr:hypothetical protein TorRG33x02_005840 [Trema orientale]
MCPLCNRHPESAEHLFLHCDVAQRIWFSSAWNLRPSSEHSPTMADWFRFIWDLNATPCSEVLVFSSVTLEAIWKTRNEAVHNNSSPSIHRLILTIASSTSNFGQRLQKFLLALGVTPGSLLQKIGARLTLMQLSGKTQVWERLSAVILAALFWESLLKHTPLLHL